MATTLPRPRSKTGPATSWTPEEDQKALEMLAQGKSRRAIAEALGHSRPSTSERISLLLARRSAPALAPGVVKDGNGTERRSYSWWTPEEGLQLAELSGRGWTQVQIAAAIGRSSGSVATRLRTLLAMSDGAGRTLWTADEDRQLLAMVEAGESHKDVARVLGRNYKSVGARLAKLRHGRIKNPVPEEIPNAHKPLRPMKPGGPGGVVKCLGGCDRQWKSPD